MFLASVGVALVTLFNVQTTLLLIIVSMVLIGAGLGFASTAYTLSVQNAVPWRLRGVATASTQFFRTIGGTIGVAIMGSILNAQMAMRFSPIFAQFTHIVESLPKNIAPANLLLTPALRTSLPLSFIDQLQVALAQSLFWVNALVLALGMIGLIAMFWLPGGRADLHTYKGDDAHEEAEAGVEMDTLMVG